MTTHLRLMSAAAVTIALAACGGLKSRTLPDEPVSEAEAMRSDGQSPEVIATKAAQIDALEFSEPVLVMADTDQILAKYAHVDPNHTVPAGMLKKALLYYDANLTKIANQTHLSVIDFAPKSTEPRFFVINMQDGAVTALRTSHGRGSDPNHDGVATAFSNVSGSRKSSVGYYLTAETYIGSHGYSLRLDGLSTTNSNARARAIVIHPASYVKEANVIQGRSYGCPALAPALSRDIIDKIKDGSLIYAGRSTI